MVSRFASVEDLRLEAARRVPKPFFQYLENGSFTQTTLRSNREDLDAIKLRQHVVGDYKDRKLSTTALGEHLGVPLILAPTGLCGSIHARGEILAAQAASDCQVPFCLSTMSIASIEDLAAEVGGRFWFQLYPMKDQRINESLLNRAKAAGCTTLVLTIDAQVEGTRYADVHNGLGVPPKITPGNVWSVITHPGWALRMLRSPHFTFGNLIGETRSDQKLGDLTEWVKSEFQPTIDRKLLDWIRSRWDGKLVIKGVIDVRDAVAAVESAADAIVISNHGGRQLEGAPSSAVMFPIIRDRVGHALELYADSGVRTGIDVLRFLGMGAKACFIGRAYMYGLGAGGREGVKRTIEILTDELDRSMALCGVTDAASVPRSVIYTNEVG